MAKSILDEILDTIFDAEWVGRHGEKTTVRELKLVRFFGRGGKILRNVYIPKDDSTTTEIDVVYVTVKGCFVIESKNYSGWIFGSEDQFKWTVSFPNGSKERFYNPVKQNQGHVKWLSEYLGDDTPLFSIVVFSERCELKKVTVESPDVKVVKRDELYAAVRNIWDASPDVLDEAGVETLYARLLPLTKVTIEQRQKHVEDIKQSSTTPRSAQVIQESLNNEEGVVSCPKCGSPMVIRTAKRGENAGKRFYGCSNYPKCRGIVNLD